MMIKESSLALSTVFKSLPTVQHVQSRLACTHVASGQHGGPGQGFPTAKQLPKGLGFHYYHDIPQH